MNSWTSRIAVLALIAGIDQAPAQSQLPHAVKSIGTCVLFRPMGRPLIRLSV